MIFDGFVHQLPDIDPGETAGVARQPRRGRRRRTARPAPASCSSKLLERARELQVSFPATVSHAVRQHHPARAGAVVPRRRVHRAPHPRLHPLERGGDGRSRPTSTPTASAATCPPSPRSASLYEVGFNHFFRGKDDGQRRRPRLLPGPRRARHLRPRLPRGPAHRGRPRPLPPGDRRAAGLSSYPHPRLMPDFWEFPTVSMGLGPINAHLPGPLQPLPAEPPHRRHQPEPQVWCFVGDGECDEPETLGALSLAAREQLDNLIFVVNCNLQRLDGPVRGNGKIIQELEADVPRRRLERDQGHLGLEVGRAARPRRRRRAAQQDEHHRRRRVPALHRRDAARTSASTSSAPTRGCASMVEHLTDDELRNLPRGGHDYRKLYAAYKAATENLGSGAPTVILAKTIKGWTLGPDDRGPQRHPPDQEDDQATSCSCSATGCTCRTRSPTTRSTATMPPYYRPAGGLGRVPVHDGAPPGPRRLAPAPRRARAPAARAAGRRAPSPSCSAGSGNQAVSTTMALHPPAAQPRPRRADRPARRADHPRRGPHLRHGRAVPRAQDLRRRRASSTSRSTTTCCSPTPRPATARSSRRASPRPARWRASSPPAPRYATPRRADGALLHLLFDVRLPAGRRPHLAGRRRPRPRLPARRHRRAHDAARRGPAAPGRPQPRAGVDGAGVPGLRPGLRLRGGHDRASTASTACTAPTPARTSSTTSPSTTRTTRCRRCPTAGVEEGIIAGPVQVAPTRPRGRPKRATVLFSGTAQGAARAGGGRAGRALRRRRRAVVGHVVQGAARGGARRSSAGTGCTPSQPPRTPLVTELLADGRRPGRRRHRLHEDGARPGRPLRPRPTVHARSAPTASAAPTPARRCAASSRSTPATSSSPCSPALAEQGEVKPEAVADAIARYGIDPDAPNPAAG